MSFSNSRQSYKDCEDFFVKALADDKGARLFVGPESKAEYFRARANYFRVLDRKENALIYKEGDPMYNKSVYDVLTLVLKDDTGGDWYVYAEKREIAEEDIESLSEIE